MDTRPLTNCLKLPIMMIKCDLIVSLYIKCLQCVMFNVIKHGFAPLRSQNSDIPWKKIHLDWIFMNNDLKNKCLVIKDICTGLVVLTKYKIRADQNTPVDNKRLALKLFKIFANYGVPQLIKRTSDQAYGNLLTQDFGDVLDLIGSKVPRITSRAIAQKHQSEIFS